MHCSLDVLLVGVLLVFRVPWRLVSRLKIEKIRIPDQFKFSHHRLSSFVSAFP
jgi:hypothetical protein